MPISGTGTYYSNAFQNSGQPTINLTFAVSSSYRTYKIELQRLTLSGTWENEDETSGSILANKSFSLSYVSRISNTALNTYRYKVTTSNQSSSSGSILYYK